MVSGMSEIERPQSIEPLFYAEQGISVVCLYNHRRGHREYLVALKGIDSDMIESTHHDQESATARAEYIASRRKTRDDVLQMIKNIQRFKKMES